MIHYGRGNLLEADAEVLVNTVNCVGVMGKGIALQFKQAFPLNTRAYEAACRASSLKPGDVFVYELGPLFRPRYIFNVATKQHWRSPSRLEYIERGMAEVVRQLRERRISSIAIPPLGCGNGGLDWKLVRPVIESALARVPEVEAVVFAPGPPPAAQIMPVRTERPRMTPGRALLVQLMALYLLPGYKLTKLEIQKLAYFLQCSGEDLKLAFVANRFGPYAANLDHAFHRLEGHFVRGYGDRTTTSGIGLLPGASLEAEQFLRDHPAANERLDRVARLIEGFENPFGLELLATVHWLSRSSTPAEMRRPDLIAMRVARWSPRKRRLFTPAHVAKAHARLSEQGWLAA